MTTPKKLEDGRKAKRNAVRRTLRDLKPHVAAVGRGSTTKDGQFRCQLRAAMMKAYEFTSFTFKRNTEPFFATATLRGICEDFIAFSFLEPLPERNEAVTLLLLQHLIDAGVRQGVFFATNRPWQATVNYSEEERDKA